MGYPSPYGVKAGSRSGLHRSDATTVRPDVNVAEWMARPSGRPRTTRSSATGGSQTGFLMSGMSLRVLAGTARAFGTSYPFSSGRLQHGAMA